MARLPDGLPLFNGSHEDSLRGGGRLYKDGGARLHHALDQTHVAHIAMLRGESADDRQEIGRWFTSATQDPAVCHSKCSEAEDRPHRAYLGNNVG